jgi:hypothetical protein
MGTRIPSTHTEYYLSNFPNGPCHLSQQGKNRHTNRFKKESLRVTSVIPQDQKKIFN